MLNKSIYQHLLVFILLVFSGNPIITSSMSKYATIVGLLIIIIFSLKKNLFNHKFKKKFLLIFLGIVVIVCFQYLELKFVSFLAIANLLAKIAFGGLVINYLNREFPKIYFNVLSFLSFTSLIFYVLITLLEVEFPSINLEKNLDSYFLYTSKTDIDRNQNSGMFWEPGAFAGIITLGLLLNFNNFRQLLRSERYKFSLIVLALITTQSTTGYIVGFFITIFYVLYNKNVFLAALFFPLLIISGMYIYNANDFLKFKIERQFKKSTEQSVGEFSNSRFGSLIFDWHYIEKHPLVGNGFNNKTRYADHQSLFSNQEDDKDVIASGNGFSHYLASMGLVFMLTYFLYIIRASKKVSKRFTLLFSLVIFFNLQGEQWLNYPLYLGLPFLVFNAEGNFTVDRKRVNLDADS